MLLFLLLSACSGQVDFDINNENIRMIVEKDANTVDVHRYFSDHDVRSYLHSEFIDFYKERDYELAWLSFDEPTSQADELLEAIDAASEEGLSPEHYNMTNIETLLSEVYDIESRKKRRKEWRRKLVKSKKFKERFYQKDLVLFNQIVRLDFLMTANYLTYASRLLSGTIRPDETAEWYSEPRQKDLSEHLSEALKENEVKESLMKLNPPHPQYNKLKEKLAFFRSLRDKGGWDQYHIRTTLKPGDEDKAVLRLRKRLQITHYLEKSDNLSPVYDEELKKAVQMYQMHRGLEPTGTVNQETRTMLNEPIESIINKIAFNMERMRWIHGPFGDHYVLVNIPAFQMNVVKNDQVQVRMKAIVGEKVNKTPVFHDSLEYIVFSPEWNVPRSIAVNEMLPRLRRDPSYLRNRNFKLYPNWNRNTLPISQNSVNWYKVTPENFNFRIVEGPGPSNSLGRVKFIFPNSNSVYLHDTPAHHLFSQNRRDFSHGCVRLEKPETFARYLLADKGWDEQDVKDYMNKTEPATVVLAEKLPVYIVYWTAWVDEKNNYLNLRDDVYSYDENQMKLIEQKEAKLMESKIGI